MVRNINLVKRARDAILMSKYRGGNKVYRSMRYMHGRVRVYFRAKAVTVLCNGYYLPIYDKGANESRICSHPYVKMVNNIAKFQRNKRPRFPHNRQNIKRK